LDLLVSVLRVYIYIYEFIKKWAATTHIILMTEKHGSYNI